MNNRVNPESDTSDTDAQQVRQPTPPTADSSQQSGEWTGIEAPQDDADVQSNPVIINR